MDVNYKDWIELSNLVFDQKTVSVEAILVHGFADLRDEMIDFVADTYKNSGAKFMVLNGESEYEIGSPGLVYWRSKLTEHGVPEENIFSFIPGRQTREEAIGLMNFVKDNNVHRAIVVSGPTYVIRAFLTNLALIKEYSISLNLYPMMMKNVNWEKQIIIRGLAGDSPEGLAPRLAKFAGEWGKILQYREKYEQGDMNYSIASIKEGIEYLKNLSNK